MHALKDCHRPTEITQDGRRDRARKPRRILPEIRSGRDWTRGPRLITPGGLSPGGPSASALGASYPPEGLPSSAFGRVLSLSAKALGASYPPGVLPSSALGASGHPPWT